MRERIDAGVQYDEAGRQTCALCGGYPVQPLSGKNLELASIVPGPHPAPIAWSRVTTLDSLPGHRLVRSLGPITALIGSSGFTANSKGHDALAGARGELLAAADSVGANAVLGLTACTFGAGGGITSVFGGDAVGVMLMGTAAVVEPDSTTEAAPLSLSSKDP
jgi:uncharacterized protein YbjQ (UPF0145 family)